MNDVISRQAAIDAAKKLLDYYGTNAISKEFADHTAEQFMNRVPSAQSERKKGKWRRKLVDCGFNADWHCSRCGWKTSLEEHGYNFCPNCGADMRGEEG